MDHNLNEETLTGDVRDMLLTHMRAMETPWSKLSEREQQDKIWAATSAAETLVRGAVRIVSNKGFPHLIVSTGKWAVKDGIKLEVISSASVENITALAEHGSGGAILVLCEAGAFFGEQQPAKPEPDQPDMLADEPESEVEADEAPRPDEGEATPIADVETKKGRGARKAA